MNKYVVTVTPRINALKSMQTLIEAKTPEAAVHHLIKAYEPMFLSGQFLSGIRIREEKEPEAANVRFQLTVNGDGHVSSSR